MKVFNVILLFCILIVYGCQFGVEKKVSYDYQKRLEIVLKKNEVIKDMEYYNGTTNLMILDTITNKYYIMRIYN